MRTWKQVAARRDLGYCVAGLAGLGYLVALVYDPWRTLGITGVCVLAGACLIVTVGNYLRKRGDPDFAAACDPVAPPAPGPVRTSDNWSGPEAQLRLALHACYLSGMTGEQVGEIILSESLAQLHTLGGANG